MSEIKKKIGKINDFQQGDDGWTLEDKWRVKWLAAGEGWKLEVFNKDLHDWQAMIFRHAEHEDFARFLETRGQSFEHKFFVALKGSYESFQATHPKEKDHVMNSIAWFWQWYLHKPLKLFNEKNKVINMKNIPDEAIEFVNGYIKLDFVARMRIFKRWSYLRYQQWRISHAPTPAVIRGHEPEDNRIKLHVK